MRAQLRSAAARSVRDALKGLKPNQKQQLQRGMRLLESGERAPASQLIFELAVSAPDHAEVLRACGLCHMANGEWLQAADCLARAHALRPRDMQLLQQLARAQDQADDHAGVQCSLRAAAELAESANDWFVLSLEHDRAGDLHQAYHCVQRSLAMKPDVALARLQRARCATALGHGEQAAADCRLLIARRELLARAWFMLADLKVVRLDETELAKLERTAAAPPPLMPAEERLYLQFALGKALEDAGRAADAFAVLCRANDLVARSRPWDPATFERHVSGVKAAFASLPTPAAETGQGSEVIFLVGLPRSGTTLVEQILSSHSKVEGASELPYLGRVIEAESRRRGKPFPDWVAGTSPDDWARMGQDYLRMSQRWRLSKPRATDKLPENWLYAGAALRMLPGARVIHCVRDPLDTCWSCYKQLFGPGMVHFTYSFEGLAGYWRACDKFSRFWQLQHPGRYIVQSYEALVASPEAQIRSLLASCGLDFEPDCLQFHTAQRAVRTTSALQVRRPLSTPSTPAAAYGSLLDPLRQMLRPVDTFVADA